MSAQSGYQVSGGAAEMYERYASTYMGPWVPDLIALAQLQRGERVLDLACGTGIVARHAAIEVAPSGRVTGLDFNAGMLAVARAAPAPAAGARIDWVEGSAVAMDLPNESFDVNLCQQGLQFFPDRAAALRETLRVLVPGGRALFSVWKSPSPYNVAAGNALERLAGREVAEKYRASRVVPDAEALRRMLVDAGFRAVEVHPRPMIIRLPWIENFVVGHLSSSPVAGTITGMSDGQRAEFGREVRAALQPYADGDGVANPDEVNIAMGRR